MQLQMTEFRAGGLEYKLQGSFSPAKRTNWEMASSLARGWHREGQKAHAVTEHLGLEFTICQALSSVMGLSS